ncbi:unnamed protein product, partial [Prorocentrum cordatum]
EEEEEEEGEEEEGRGARRGSTAGRAQRRRRRVGSRAAPSPGLGSAQDGPPANPLPKGPAATTAATRRARHFFHGWAHAPVTAVLRCIIVGHGETRRPARGGQAGDALSPPVVEEGEEEEQEEERGGGGRGAQGRW